MIIPAATAALRDSMPSMGIYKVKQTVYYDSMNNEPSVTEKIVIICPIWLLFLIFFVIAAMIIWVVMRVQGRRKSEKSEKSEKKS